MQEIRLGYKLFDGSRASHSLIAEREVLTVLIYTRSYSHKS